MGDTTFGQGGGEPRRRGQQATSGAVGASSFAASRLWSATAAEGGTSYLAQRKEQIYGVFADEVEDEVEEEQAARKSGKKGRSEQLLLVSGGSSTSEEEEEEGCVDGRGSGESGDEDVPEGCVTGRGSRSSSKNKSSRRYGRRIKFVGGGVWRPDTVQEQKKRKTGEQQETGSNAAGASSTSAAGGRREFAIGAASAGGEGREETNASDTKTKKHPGSPAAAGVFEEEGEEDETETNEAGSMSLRERILNAQVLKEVLGDAYYDLSSEDEDVKAAAGDSKSQDEATTAAQGRESSTGHSSSSSNDSSSKMTKEGLEGTDAGASDAAAEGLGDHAATSRGSQQAGGPAAAPESSSSSDEDTEGGNATEKATVRQRSFRFSSSSSRGDTGAQMRQNTAQGGAGIVQPAKERNTWGFAKMEKTYGVGFKLLKKMGFKGGGLGRHGTGVANPLEVRIREKNKGLQDSGEKVERKKAARGKQLTALDILLGARKREKSAAGEEAETFAEAWKKPGKAGGSSSGAGGGAGGLSAAERRRRRLGGLSPTEMAELRVKELQQSYRSSSSSAVRRQGPAVRIIDMTGPEARVIENESELQQTLQQQKQRAAAAGARRGRKLGGGDKTGAAAERDMGRGEDDDRSDGALLSDEESLVAGGDADEEESAEDARVRNLPFKALRQQLETIVRDVEAQLESIVRDKKVGEQVLLESVDYVPMGGAAGTSSGLFARTLQCKTVAASASSERTRTAATAGEGTADSTAEQNTSAPCGSPAAGAAEAASATAARLYEEEVAAAVCDACVVADRASALLQRVQALYDHVTDSSKRAEAAGAAPPDTAAESAAVCKQAKELPADEAGKKAAATTKPGSRRHTSLRSHRLAVAGELVEETDRWSGSEDSSKSRSPSVDSVAPKRKGTSGAAAEPAGDAPSKSSAAEGSDADAGVLRAIGNSSSAASSGPYCSVDLDSLVVAAEEWRSTARFEFRLLQVPAVLAALAGLILERRLRGWAPLGVTPTALGAESAEDNAKLAVPSQKSSAAAHPFEGAGGVTASSVARLLAFLVSLQQHEEAETRVFLSAVTAADEKVRASGVAGSTCCWAAGLLAAATPGPGGGRGEVTGRGAAVAKCLQKWQEDEITKIEDEAFGARKRGAAASRRMRSTLGLFPLRLEGTTGTLRLLQLPMRECAEPYRLGFDVLEKVLQQAVVGRLRAAIINEWQPEKEGEEEFSAYANSAAAGTLAGAGAGLPGAADSTSCYRCLSVVEKWFAALPVSCAGQLTEEAVVPKLLQGINAWDPSKARVPIHMWLQPWLPYLTREHLQLLSLPLQAKIAAALDEKWHPADRSAVGLLLPWKNVFDAYSFAALLQRSVMPKLHDHLLNMPVRPDHQRLEPLQDVLAWVPLLPVEMLVNLFLTAFFPRWLQVLRVWLGTPQVDLTEVLEWYAGWKQIFPPALLAHPRVQSGVLVEALQLMNFASAAVGMQAVGAPGPAGAAGVSPHLQQPAPLGLGATSALPHVSPVHAGPAVPGAAVDPAAAAAASASPAYVLHHDLGMGASPYPAPPPTAAPPPPPSSGLAGGHIGAGGPYDFSTGVAAAAGSHVGGGAICSPGVTGVKPVEPEQPISLLDYLEGLAKEKNILFKPKPGRVEEGKQVYAYGRMNMYVKEKLIYVKGKALHSWTAVDVDELLKLAKGEWTKLKGTTYERK